MAGPVLNVKIIAKSLSHSLRAISVVTFPPAFIILLIQGIASRRVNPAIGILPLFFSSAFSLLLLANEKKCGCQNSGLSGTPIHLVFDLLLGIGLLVCLILTWVFLPGGWNRAMIMIGTYGSNFLIINFAIHCYFTGKQLFETLQPGMSYPASCPQCQFQPFQMGININSHSRHGYAPLLDRQGEPTAADEERLNEAEAAV